MNGVLPLENHEPEPELPLRYRFTGRMAELIHGYNAIVRLLFPRYAWYVFPGYLLWAIFQRYQKLFKGKYRLVPIPNNLHSLLTAKEFFKSEHFLFAHPEVYEKYVIAPQLNFVQLAFKSTDNDVDDKDNPFDAIIIQLLPKSNCPKNCLYIKVRMKKFVFLYID